ncbi:MAG: AAA family ATPase [Dermatophilaceae bacterium]
MSQLAAAVDALLTVAERAGVPADQARDEALALAAAIAESAPGAASDWVASQDGASRDLAVANAAFFDAASKGRKWRQSPTTLLTELAMTDRDAAAAYAKALAEVASAACTLGEPTMRVTGNASVAAAAQLAATAPSTTPPDARELLGRLPGWSGSGTPGPLLDPYQLHGPQGGAGQWTRAPETPGLPPAGGGEPGERHTGEPATQGTSPAAEPEPQPEQPSKSVEELLAELDALIGLERVKREVHQQVAMLKVDALRRQAGLKSPDLTRHLVFVGNPGTGKTTVARMVGGIYRALGLLTKGQLVEIDRSELVAGYLGQTAIKTAEVCAKAYGGVLFIDEAYALSGDQYGQEAVNTLVKEMEDHRDDLVVIVAGYPDPMVVFIAQNPGLASRFKTVIEFEDYSDEEIVGILLKLAGASDYTVTPDAEARFRDILGRTARTEAFGNGRFARNVLEEAIGRQAWRLRDAHEPTPEQLRNLLAEDFHTEDPSTGEPHTEDPRSGDLHTEDPHTEDSDDAAAKDTHPMELANPTETSVPVELVDIERTDPTPQPPDPTPQPPDATHGPRTGAPE